VDKSNASATPNSIVTELGEIGKKRAEALVAVQAELLNRLQAISQHWAVRAKSEAALASELMTKLTNTHTVPEIAAVYQEWASRRMRMVVDDSQRLFADSLKLMETGARLFSSRSTGGGT
jgi:hypothetical protein